jgi:hypothetical protein
MTMTATQLLSTTVLWICAIASLVTFAETAFAAV